MALLPRLLTALVFSLAGVHAVGQTGWPTKPVRIIVPFAPGGTADIAARIVADQLTKSFAQSCIAENRAGASGNIGAAEVARRLSQAIDAPAILSRWSRLLSRPRGGPVKPHSTGSAIFSRTLSMCRNAS